MTVKRRVETLEKKSPDGQLKTILILQGQDFQGVHDEEAAIDRKLTEIGCQRDDCRIIVVWSGKREQQEEHHDN